MARFVGPSTIWCKKLFQLCSELLPCIRVQHCLEKRTGSLYTPCFCLCALLILFVLPAMSFHSCMSKSNFHEDFYDFSRWKHFHSLELPILYLYLHYIAHRILLYSYFCTYLPSLLEYMPSRKCLISTQAFNIFMGSIEVCFILESFLVTDYTLVSWLMVNI